jgi:UDP-N-acetylmuramate--L-alanine ligase/UDP-N-acetylenolpyruvoylglucosamine reductase
MQPDANSSTANLRALIGAGAGHAHLAGICGIGMAGLAVLLKARGFKVTGCDLMANKLAGWLRQRDIQVAEQHSPAHITPDVSWIVRSAAVPPTADEIKTAGALRIPVFKRGEVLPLLLEGSMSIAIAGTHGKTTTTTFIAQVLRAAGRDPTFCIGGEVEPLGGVAGIGQGGITVVEADESDGTLALYAPDVAIVTNIDFDHMEHFASVEAFEDCFRTFVGRARRRVVYCADDPRAARLCGGLANGLSYGLTSAAAIHAASLHERAAGTEFALFRGPELLGRLTVPAPGRHNVLNALACAAAALELGLTADEVRTALGSVSLPRRRFDRLVDRDDVVVVSDYAHHPAEIAALVRAAEHLHRPRTLAVFQPHRYTRTLALGPDFPAAFKGLGELVLLPVYAASEQPLAGGSIWDLYGHCRKHAGLNVTVAGSLRQAWEYYRGQLRLGDLLLVIGAGDVERIALWARDELRQTRVDELGSLIGRAIRQVALDTTVIRGQEPLAGKTTLGVGGKADLWMEFGSEQDLVKVLKWTWTENIPFQVLGGGSNVLVSDLGVRGVVARLSGEPFRQIVERNGLVVAGAGTALAKLLAWAEDRALAGVEFLEGIPGAIGGALHGNAGAFGHAIGDRVAWLRGFDRDGSPWTLTRDQLDFGYRRCPRLKDLIVVEAAFSLEPGDRARIQQERTEHTASRAWMRGIHSAGSVFKNPPGDHAGRLIEQAGLKRFTIGGAAILDRHANVIATEPGARASDVMAVMECARDEVRRRFGVVLEPEIVMME